MRIVIAGAGHAAGQAVATLRQQGFDGQIVLIGDEPHLPYQRPPLSKKFLAGELAPERLYFKPASFYEDPQIELHLETRITAIDRKARQLHVDGGDGLAYDKLLIATGARARDLPVPGVDLQGVHSLRTIADVDGIRNDLDSARRVVIVGAGYIGMEVAAVIRMLGLDVTVVEMTDRVMSRVVSPEISDFFQIEHTNRGVKLRLGTSVTALHGKRRVRHVETNEGDEIPADLVVIGIGIVPNTELADEAGLDVDDGIIVDDRCCTSDPDIYAIGDCTRHPNDIYGKSLRLESVHNALEQARTAAANLCGSETHYSQVPWFWSDQYELKLQIAGLSEGYDDVVIRGNPAEKQFSCIYLRDGRLIAVDAVNSPKDFMQSKALIAEHALMMMDGLADPAQGLKDLVADS